MSSEITKKIPCEFARDCLTPDGETCPNFADPDDCGKYHRILLAEEVETIEEYNEWLRKKGKK